MGVQSSHVFIADIEVLSQIGFGRLYNEERENRVVATTEFVHQYCIVKEEAAGVGVDIESMRPGSAQVGGVHINRVRPTLGKQCRVQRHFPFHNIAIVIGPQILHLDVPVAIEWTIDHIAEVLEWMIDLRHIGNIAGIDAVGGGASRIPVRVVLGVDVAGLEAVAIRGGRILVAQCGVVGPDIVPWFPDWVEG